ncbi:MAG: cyclase family protein [Bacteroidota bacterium]
MSFRLTFTIGEQSYEIGNIHDISIPLSFNGPQPNTYGVPTAQSKPYEGQGFIGDVKQGGSCNFEQYTFIPHCNGTHTEGAGHLTASTLPIHHILKESFFPATLISVPLTDIQHSPDSYQPSLEKKDRFVDRKALEIALEGISDQWLQALVIRTLPNSEEKKERNYMKGTCPFFSNEAMEFIREKKIQHLLMDFPSVDRLFDEGRLSNHRIFWGMPTSGHMLPQENDQGKTLTEMVFVADHIGDGHYLLEIQLAAFMSDASPSRPRLLTWENT